MISEASDRNGVDEVGPPRTSDPRRPLPRSQQILVRLCALVAGVSVAALIIFFLSRDRTPEVTPAILDEAVARWEQAGVTSYDLRVNTSGRRPEQIEIKVRDGEVTSFTIDDRVMPKDRLTDTWTVPMQFDFIRNDLRAADLPENEHAMRPVGVFDKEFGYPRRYRCPELYGRSETSWEVTRFDVVNP